MDNQTPPLSPTPTDFYAPFQTGQPVNVGEHFKISWSTWKATWTKFAALILCAIGISMIIPVIVFGVMIGVALTSAHVPGTPLTDLITSSANTWGFYVGIGFIIAIPLFIVIMFALAYFQYAMIVLTTRLNDRPDFVTNLKVTKQKFWGLIWVNFLSGLIAFAGCLFLIIPGMIMAFYLSFSSYVYLTEDLHGVAALKRSYQLIRGYGWLIIQRSVVWIYIYCGIMIITFIPILGQITQLIIPIVMTPLSLIFFYSLYRQIRDQKNRGQAKTMMTQKAKIVTLILILIPGFLLSLLVIAIIAFGNISQKLLPTPAEESFDSLQFDFDTYPDNGDESATGGENWSPPDTEAI